MDHDDTQRLIDEARAVAMRLDGEEDQDLQRLLLDLADTLATAQALWLGLAGAVAAWAPRDVL